MERWHGGAPLPGQAALSRREFIKLAGINALALGAALYFPRRASAHGSGPNPIPGGIQPFGPGTTVYHVLLPGYPPFGSPNPAENDPSLVTDFNGHVGLAYVQGMGTRTDKSTGVINGTPVLSVKALSQNTKQETLNKSVDFFCGFCSTYGHITRFCSSSNRMAYNANARHLYFLITSPGVRRLVNDLLRMRPLRSGLQNRPDTNERCWRQ